MQNVDFYEEKRANQTGKHMVHQGYSFMTIEKFTKCNFQCVLVF